MQSVPERPNIELRKTTEHGEIVVLSFPYDVHIVSAVRGIPQRRFDWDKKEWWAPVDDWCAVHVADVLDRFPDLVPTDEVATWLEGVDRRWVGSVSVTRHEGGGWWVMRTRAGRLPEALAAATVEYDGRTLLPMSAEHAEALRELSSARIDTAAERCMTLWELGEQPPPARLAVVERVGGRRLKVEVLWDPDAGAAFERLPAAETEGTMPLDPWVIEQLDHFIALHEVEVRGLAKRALDELRARARRGADPDPPLARDRGRPDSRGRRRPRRRAGAVPVGRRALRARRPPRVPRR